MPGCSRVLSRPFSGVATPLAKLGRCASSRCLALSRAAVLRARSGLAALAAVAAMLRPRPLRCSASALALSSLVAQNCALVLFMRYSRVPKEGSGPMYLASTAVVMDEALKITISLICFFCLSARTMPAWDKDVEPTTWGGVLRYVPGGRFVHRLLAEVFTRDGAAMIVPALLYTVQKNFLFVAISNLDACVYQVLSQAKIFTTALCSWAMLGTEFSMRQRLALLALMAGLILVEATHMSGHMASPKNPEERPMRGVAATAVAVWTSAFASVFFEHRLKRSSGSSSSSGCSSTSSSGSGGGGGGGCSAATTATASPPSSAVAAAAAPEEGASTVVPPVSSAFSAPCTSSVPSFSAPSSALPPPSSPPPSSSSPACIWVRNLQLGGFSLILAVANVLINDRLPVLNRGFFEGYDRFVVATVLLQACGGLIVALVIKYADNVAKNFANGLALVAIGVFSNIFWHFRPSVGFLLGSALTVGAAAAYGVPATAPPAASAAPAVGLERLEESPEEGERAHGTIKLV